MRPLPWQLKPAAYDFRYRLSPHYSHLDTERHVNNVAVHSFYTEARTRYQLALWGDDAWYSDHVLLRPRRTVTHFVRETHYPDDVTCAVRLVELAADRYRLALGLFQNEECVGVQECLMGAWQDGCWADLPEPVRRSLAVRQSGGEKLNHWSTLITDDEHLLSYPCDTGVIARYADLDPDRRLGELALCRYAEQSRAGPLGMLRRPGLGLLVAKVDIRYDRWDRGLGKIRLPSGVAAIGNTSFVVRGGILVDEMLVAASESVMVLMDRSQRRPTPVTAALREAMAEVAIGAGNGGYRCRKPASGQSGGIHLRDTAFRPFVVFDDVSLRRPGLIC